MIQKINEKGWQLIVESSSTMIKNYFNIALRNLWKHKVFSIVNISGLAIGLSAFWLITLYVANELSYDRYHKNADQIYRVVSHAKWDGGNFDISGTSAPLAPALKNDYPEIQETVRINPEERTVLSFGDKHFQEDDISFADKTLFDVFSYRFLYGDAKTALAKPQSIVLTKTLAIKIFGDPAKALNQTIIFENDYPNLVTGVIEDVTANSHYIFKAVRSFPRNFTESWGEMHLITYIKLLEGANIKKLEARLPQFVDKHLKARLLEGGLNNVNFWIELQPLTSIHLHSNLQNEVGSNGNMYVYIFSVIGILILIIASINYMNLSTARALLRIKEIGLRKVAGSSKSQLIMMFLAEAVLLTLIATLIAVIIIQFVLPLYNKFTDKEIKFWYLGVGNTLAILLSFSLLTGLISGIYPALFLSNFRLLPALKGQAENHSVNFTFRKSLVTFQFIVTICMISGSLIIYQQLRYVLKKDLGFNKDQVLTFHLENNGVDTKIQALKNQLLHSSLIENVASASTQVGNNVMNLNSYNIETNGIMEQKSRLAHYFTIDEDFISTLQLKLAKGRNYLKDMGTDKTRSLIVNEALVKDAGWKNPIGKKIIVGDAPYTVIGVAKDFHFFSLQHKIEPLLMALPLAKAENNNLYVRISSKNIPLALNYIEQTYRKFDIGSPFNYSFLDQNFAKQYKSEQKQGNTLLMFTVLAISIACLGLFGLVTFMVEQRIKEIGVRKVLGASVKSIVGLISKDFIKLVFIGALIAVPIAWWAMNKWLQDFAYRIEISWWVFALAGILAVSIAILTVSFHAIKAAISKPVKSLRTE